MKKLIIVVIIVAAVVGLSIVGQQRGGPSVDEVRVFEVIEQPIESTVLATGTLTYGDERSVRAELNARVEEVRVDEGDPVREGQILIVLEQDDFETEMNNQRTNVTLREIDIERAQLQIESLNIQLDRQQRLFDQNAAQASTLEDLRNQIAQAQVNIKMQRQLLEQSKFNLLQAEKRLAKTVIRSPMDGLISALDIKEGEMAVATGADVPLLTLVDPTQIYSEVDVDEADIGNVQLGQDVRIFAVAYLDTPLTGVVTDIATSARQVPGKNSLVFPVEVEIQPQDDVVLRPGMSTRAEILNSTDRAYPLVPIEAVQEGDEASQYRLFVYENGIARMRVVTLGPQDDRYQAITDGLTVGESVITGPYRVVRSLSDGVDVRVEPDNENSD